MLLDRQRITRHLSRIHVEGTINEVVLQGNFEAAAMQPGAQQLVVIAAPLQGVEALPQALGLSDVGLFIKALKGLSAESAEIGITFEGGRIGIAERNGANYRLVTLEPGATASRMEEPTIAAVKALLDTVDWIPLTEIAKTGVVSAYDLLKPAELKVIVGTALEVQVGQDMQNFARLTIGQVAQAVQPAVSLTFSAKLVADVLKQVTDFTAAQIGVSAPTPTGSRALGVREGGYLYMITPMQ